MLTPEASEFFTTRGIDPETAVRYGVRSAKRDSGEVIEFPYREGENEVNVKSRAKGKRFWQRAGGKSTFWNFDAIHDPALRGDHPSRLVITEGEPDALSAIEAGYPLAVSVPAGACLTAHDGPIDPSHDAKFEFVWNAWEALKAVKAITIATDDDEPGKVMAAELVRRLGADRCFFVTYPAGCKDLNDVLVAHGKEGVLAVIHAAKPYPVRGLYTLSEFPDLPQPTVYSTGWNAVDKHFKIELGGLVLVTGIPNHGKSSWVNALCANLVHLHGWSIVLASFETPVVPHQRDHFRQLFNAKRVEYQSPAERAAADRWTNERIHFIAQNPLHDDEDMDLDYIIDKAEIAVVRHGIRLLVLDPWNEIEHKRRRDETGEEYQSRAIRILRRFARRFEVCVIVVAHPVKMLDGAKPSLYHVSGSAHWYNKPDIGIVVYRPDKDVPEVEVDVKKVRFGAHGGKPGAVTLVFDDQAARFNERQAGPDDVIGEISGAPFKAFGPPLTEQEMFAAKSSIRRAPEAAL